MPFDYRSIAFSALLLPTTIDPLHAANSIPIKVSLVIEESCLVHDAPGQAPDAVPPSVSCTLGSPYRVHSGTLQPSAARSATAVAPSLWQVTF